MVNIVGVPNSYLGYKVIFFAGAGFTALMAMVVMVIPESIIYAKETIAEDDLVAEEDQEGMATGINPNKRISLFLKDFRLASRQYWKMFLFCIAFASVYNWMTHACQDIFPSYLKVQKGFTSREASLAAVLGQCAALIAGPMAGYYSQFFGRRQTSIVCIVFAWIFIPLFTLPNGYNAIMAGVFWLLFWVNGAWGIMPILLNEYSPPQFRAVFPGTVYQIGNLISAPAAVSQTAAASGWIRDGKANYNQVMTIFMCVIFLFAVVICAMGPERRGSHFELIKRAGAVENIRREEKDLGLRPLKSVEGHDEEHAGAKVDEE
jgi:SHS family lactate transporter-like MFS transporter